MSTSFSAQLIMSALCTC